MEDDKNKQNINTDESNAERDQDEGEMNNGTLGGSLGVIGISNEDKHERVTAAGSKSEEKSTEDSVNKPGGDNN